MRYLLAVLLVAVSATQAGYVEDVIWLADSSQSLQSIRALLHVPEDSTVWAGGAKVMVFDRDLTRTLAKFVAPPSPVEEWPRINLRHVLGRESVILGWKKTREEQ